MGRKRFIEFSASRVTWLVALPVYLLSPSFAVFGQEKSGPVSFIRDIAPIFKESCLGCHGSKNPKGKLDMTRYDLLRKGGTKDDPIVEGKPEDSYLMDVLIATDKKRMPPLESGEPLPPEKIKRIEQWIREGARLDDGIRKDSDLQKELRKRWQPPALLARYPYPATITALAFSPDGKTLVSSGHHELAVWDSQTGQLVKRVHIRARRAMSMVFLPDGKLVVAGGRPGEEGDVSVYNINANSGKKEQGVTILDGVNDKSVLISRLLEAEDEVLSVAISKDGKKLATGGCDRMVNVWDIGQGIEKAVMETPIENHADWVFSVQFSPDGKHLYTSSRDKTAKVWDLKAKESVLTFPDHQNTVYAVVPKADGKGGYSVGEDNQLRLWGNTGDQAGKQIKNVGAHGKAVLKVLAIAGQPLLATCGADGVVKVWNADSFAAVRTLENLGDQVYSLAVSPDQKWIAAGSFNGEVKIWKLADGGLIKGFNASPGLATASKK